MNNFFNTFNDSSTGAFNNYDCTFNPINKIIELYEALVKSEKEKVELLQSLLDKNRQFTIHQIIYSLLTSPRAILSIRSMQVCVQMAIRY